MLNTFLRSLRHIYFTILFSVVIFSLSACTIVNPRFCKVAKPSDIISISHLQNGIVQTLQYSSFKKVPGWLEDNVHEVWPAFLVSCATLAKKNASWQAVCSKALQVNSSDPKVIRDFFENNLIPYQVRNLDGSDVGLITGYYEPVLRGARKKGGPYQVPLHGTPTDLLNIDWMHEFYKLKNTTFRGRVVNKKFVPYYSRAELMKFNVLLGKELVWVNNPVDAFFFQVQGSGRIYLSDTGETIRLAYANHNGYPYKSIGRYLVNKGEISLSKASVSGIKAWVAAHPMRQQELFNINPRYVFFKEEKILDVSKGPKGAMGFLLTSQRSIAVDPHYIPLGSPVFIATTQPNSTMLLRRLVLAQDTGVAIRGAVRADYFWGFGREAGVKASAMKQYGKMWVLQPKFK